MRKEPIVSELTNQQLDALHVSPEWTTDTLESIRARVHAASAPAARPARRRKRTLFVLIAAAAVVAASVTAGASYQKWSLPEPKTYTGHMYSQQGEASSYSMDSVASMMPEETPPLSDEAFIQAGCALFEGVGVPVTDVNAVTVTRQLNQGYDRQEVVVAYGSNIITATFNAVTGDLINASRFVYDGVVSPLTDDEAAARAAQFYEALPVPQGYELCAAESFDTNIRTYHFERRTPLGILTPYEAVKVTINPETGAFISCNVFSTMLLDDHDPDDQPLTEAEAIQIGARYMETLDPTHHYTLIEADLRVEAPNYLYVNDIHAAETMPAPSVSNGDSVIETTPDPDAYVSKRYADVTRYVYVLKYLGPQELFRDEMALHIDLYTGELLGGNALR